MSTVDFEQQEELARQIVTVEQGGMINSKSKPETLRRLLDQTTAHPLWIAQTIFEPGSASTRAQLNDLVSTKYGIDLSTQQYGVCNPDAALAVQKQTFLDFYNLALNRMGLGIYNPLSLDQLRELGVDLEIDRRVLTTKIPSYQKVDSETVARRTMFRFQDWTRSVAFAFRPTS